MKTLTQTDAPVKRWAQVTVTELGIRPWEGQATAVKWSAESGWWVDVKREDGTWSIHESCVKEKGDDDEDDS